MDDDIDEADDGARFTEEDLARLVRKYNAT